MMTMVRTAACAGALSPDSTNGLAAAPPRKVLRDKVLREIERVVIGKPPSWLAALAQQAMRENVSARRSEKGLRRERQDHRLHHPFRLAFGFASRATLVEPTRSSVPA